MPKGFVDPAFADGYEAGVRDAMDRIQQELDKGYADQEYGAGMEVALIVVTNLVEVK